jgi:aquaporin Z
MRAMNIRTNTGSAGFKQLKASWKKNWRHYFQEALGLALFMIAACFFGGMLEAKDYSWHHAIPNDAVRRLIMGILMGTTALFIFYSPFTAPSGSQINPAVTLTYLRLNKMCHWDAVFYVTFQLMGGMLSVYFMQWMMGNRLTSSPVYSVVTVPGKDGIVPALLTEILIAFVTMALVLYTSVHEQLKKYTRLIAAALVCCWVFFAGPISGFGMNPARTIASALPAGIWTGWWIYLFAPVAGMLLAAEVFLFTQRHKYIKSLS